MKLTQFALFATLALPCLCNAQINGFSGSAAPDFKDPTSFGGGTLLLSPFKYIAPAGAENESTEPAIKRPPSQQKLMDLNAEGNYQALGSEGLALMAAEPVDEELQLIIANSLAWTGRVKDAVPTYQSLTKGKFANEANVGLANINRWRGRDDLAMPLYKSVLDKDPANADALEGIALASREMSPRTTLSGGGSSDSSDLKRRIGTINHRWRDTTGAQIFEAELGGFHDWLPNAYATQQEVTLRYQNLDMALKPSLELNMATKLNPAMYGTARVKLFNDQVTVGAGRVNWGKISINPLASIGALSANYLGADATHSYSTGTVTGRIANYAISDGNSVLTSSINFDSSWRPLGSHFKPFAGIETRGAKVNKPTYWSPVDGSGTAYAGLMGEWGAAEWNFFGSVQLGAPIYGDAGNSWSISAGGKRWVTNDISLGMNVWSMASWRDNSAYRAQSANVFLEKVWR